ncbi:MAG: hypothetical protein AVDCRST_MAG01-01-4973, partial [uncultured Rubrobacteraceae bacterium]
DRRHRRRHRHHLPLVRFVPRDGVLRVGGHLRRGPASAGAVRGGRPLGPRARGLGGWRGGRRVARHRRPRPSGPAGRPGRPGAGGRTSLAQHRQGV